MACFYRLVAVMWMQIADLVVDGRTPVGWQTLISWLQQIRTDFIKSVGQAG